MGGCAQDSRSSPLLLGLSADPLHGAQPIFCGGNASSPPSQSAGGSHRGFPHTADPGRLGAPSRGHWGGRVGGLSGRRGAQRGAGRGGSRGMRAPGLDPGFPEVRPVRSWFISISSLSSLPIPVRKSSTSPPTLGRNLNDFSPFVGTSSPAPAPDSPSDRSHRPALGKLRPSCLPSPTGDWTRGASPLIGTRRDPSSMPRTCSQQPRAPATFRRDLARFSTEAPGTKDPLLGPPLQDETKPGPQLGSGHHYRPACCAPLAAPRSSSPHPNAPSPWPASAGSQRPGRAPGPGRTRTPRPCRPCRP